MFLEDTLTCKDEEIYIIVFAIIVRCLCFTALIGLQTNVLK